MLQKQQGGQITSSPRLRLDGRRRNSPSPHLLSRGVGPKSTTRREYSEYRGKREGGRVEVEQLEELPGARWGPEGKHVH